MGETKYEKGIIDSWNVQGNRLTFKLNSKTFSCFDTVKEEAFRMFTDTPNDKIKIEYYDNIKNKVTFHNCTKVAYSELQAKNVPIEDVISKRYDINGAFFGMCSNQAISIILHNRTLEGKTFTTNEESLKDYEEMVIGLFNKNKQIKEKLQDDQD